MADDFNIRIGATFQAQEAVKGTQGLQRSLGDLGKASKQTNASFNESTEASKKLSANFNKAMKSIQKLNAAQARADKITENFSKVLGRGQKAQEGLRKATDETTKSNNAFGKVLKTAGSQFRFFVGGLSDSLTSIVRVREIVETIRNSIKFVAESLIEYDKVSKDLTTSLETFGNLTGASEQALRLLDNTVRAVSVSTKVARLDLLNAASTLSAAGASASQTIRAMVVLGNVSATTGKEVNEVAATIAETFAATADDIPDLSRRLILPVDNLSVELLRQGGAIDLLEDKYGNLIKGAETIADRVREIVSVWSESRAVLIETLNANQELRDVIDQITNNITSWIRSISVGEGFAQRLASVFRSVQNVVITLEDAFSRVFDFVQKIAETLDRDVVSLLGSLGFGVAGGAVGGELVGAIGSVTGGAIAAIASKVAIATIGGLPGILGALGLTALGSISGERIARGIGTIGGAAVGAIGFDSFYQRTLEIIAGDLGGVAASAVGIGSVLQNTITKQLQEGNITDEKALILLDQLRKETEEISQNTGIPTIRGLAPQNETPFSSALPDVFTKTALQLGVPVEQLTRLLPELDRRSKVREERQRRFEEEQARLLKETLERQRRDAAQQAASLRQFIDESTALIEQAELSFQNIGNSVQKAILSPNALRKPGERLEPGTSPSSVVIGELEKVFPAEDRDKLLSGVLNILQVLEITELNRTREETQIGTRIREALEEVQGRLIPGSSQEQRQNFAEEGIAAIVKAAPQLAEEFKKTFGFDFGIISEVIDQQKNTTRATQTLNSELKTLLTTGRNEEFESLKDFFAELTQQSPSAIADAVLDSNKPLQTQLRDLRKTFEREIRSLDERRSGTTDPVLIQTLSEERAKLVEDFNNRWRQGVSYFEEVVGYYEGAIRQEIAAGKDNISRLRALADKQLQELADVLRQEQEAEQEAQTDFLNELKNALLTAVSAVLSGIASIVGADTGVSDILDGLVDAFKALQDRDFALQDREKQAQEEFLKRQAEILAAGGASGNPQLERLAAQFVAARQRGDSDEALRLSGEFNAIARGASDVSDQMKALVEAQKELLDAIDQEKARLLLDAEITREEGSEEIREQRAENEAQNIAAGQGAAQATITAGVGIGAQALGADPATAQAISGFVGQFLDAAQQVDAEGRKALDQFFEGFFAGFANIGTAITKNIDVIIEGLIKGSNALVIGLFDALILNFPTLVVNVLRGVVRGITGSVKLLVNYLTDVDTWKSALSDLGDSIVAFFGDVIDYILDIVVKPTEGVINSSLGFLEKTANTITGRDDIDFGSVDLTDNAVGRLANKISEAGRRAQERLTPSGTDDEDEDDLVARAERRGIRRSTEERSRFNELLAGLRAQREDIPIPGGGSAADTSRLPPGAIGPQRIAFNEEIISAARAFNPFATPGAQEEEQPLNLIIQIGDQRLNDILIDLQESGYQRVSA